MADPNPARVRRIIDKLGRVRARGLACFGSDKHRFRLNSPLADATVRAFEAEHRIQLPDDYRAFLTQAGNGGAGPYYGIFRLEQWSDFADWVLDERPDDFLARPCPLHPEMKADEWTERFDRASRYQGTLSLGSRGCAYATQLVVARSLRWEGRLCRCGRQCAVQRAMLAENREPVRRNANGLSVQSSVHSISALTQRAVQASPHAAWRALAKRRWFGGWW